MADTSRAIQKSTGRQPPKPSGESKKEIAKRLAALATATGENLTAERIDLYVQAFAQLPTAKLLATLERMLYSCRWFPKIPDVREAVLGKPGDAFWEIIAGRVQSWAGRLELEADAFAGGFSCGRQVARFDLSGLDEAAKLALIRLGGPRAIAASGDAFLPNLKEKFLREYDAICIERPHLLVEDAAPGRALAARSGRGMESAKDILAKLPKEKTQ